MATDALEYGEISILTRGTLNGGRLKLHKGGAVFKSNKTGKVDQFATGEVDAAYWMRVARGYELKIVLSNGTQFKFEGFKESDYDNLSRFITKNFYTNLEEVELSVKGWNWGTASFKGPSLSFDVDNKPAFEIPLKDVSQATTGKNEVALEFHPHDDAEISLMEMRFYIPPPSADADDQNPVKAFQDQVLEHADIIQATGVAIVSIPEVACLTPRGRYTVKVYPTFVQLHGKTYDYKIPYTTVLRLFLLPHKDQRFMFFVISVDPPIKQGQTRYPFLIIQFPKEEECDVKLNLTEEEIKEKYNGKLHSEMSGPLYEIISRLLKAVTGRKITVPGSYKSHTGNSGITCSHKAGSGFLYPLERGFIFVHKPPIHARFDEIATVNFARVAGGGGSSRSFDFEIEIKSGTTYVFSNIEKEEYGRLFDFVSAKHLRIKNTKMHNRQGQGKANFDDDLMASDEDDHDAYLEKVKAEAAERDDDESSEDDSDDESFDPDAAGDSDQGGNPREEYESEVSETSESGSDDDDEGESKKKKKKHKPEKRKSESKKSSPKKKAKTAAEKPSGSRKKSKKDPEAPKRAMSAYMLWLQQNRESIKQKYPGISVTEVSKKAGEMWKQITDKTKWETLAKAEKEKYAAAMKEYKEKQKESGASTSKSPKKDFFKKKEPKKSSPRKSGDSTKFKSAEFVETSDESSSEEDKKSKKKPKPKSKREVEPKKKDSSSEEEASMSEDDSEEEEAVSEGSDSD